MTCTLPSVNPGAAETGLSISVAPVGNARHAQAGGVHLHALPVVMRLQDRAGIFAHVDAARRRRSATASAVMSSWVGPIPPEVKTWSYGRDSALHRRDDRVGVVG
jgi:hypothetical protein